MVGFNNRFNSQTVDWETPSSTFEPLNKEFGFTLDVCALPENAKCEKYFTKEQNGLKQNWEGICWMNPPYGTKKAWVIKAYNESVNGATVVCLLPVISNTNWWHDYCMKGEIRFIKGRVKFVGAKYGLPQPLAIVIFRGRRYI